MAIDKFFKVSIITVVYNNCNTIADAIQSVISQDYNNIEYIIIDGGSLDGTLKIINRYKANISKIITEEDNGIYDAMNKGLSYATGDIIGILNSDDIYADNTIISTIVNEFTYNKNIDVVYGDLVYVKYDNINAIVRYWESKKYYARYFEDGNVPPHPTLFLKRKVYEKIGNFNLNYHLASDYEFMLRLFKKYNFKSSYLNIVFVKMRLGGVTNKNFKNIIIGNKEILNAWRANYLRIPFRLIPLRIINRLSQYIYQKK